MCRNIKRLRQPQSTASEDEIELAALQFVRKVSGYRTPSRKNTAAFDEAVQQVASATRTLLRRLESASEPKSG